MARNPIAKLTLPGIDKTLARLAAHKTRFRRSAMKKAGTALARVVRPVMRANAPVAKGDYGASGGTRQSIGQKVMLFRSGTVAWIGVGPRTSFKKKVKKKYRFWRGKRGTILKRKVAWERWEQPSRRAHLTEKKTHWMARSLQQVRSRAASAVIASLEESMAKI